MIRVKLSETNSQPSKDSSIPRTNYFDTSYVGSKNPVGRLRYSRVGNANYERRHPILDENGNRVGALEKGLYDIGYTYSAVYIDRLSSFYVSHALVGVSGGSNGFISRIAPQGRFLFPPREVKFSKVDSVGMPTHLSIGSGELAFKVLGDGEKLLHLTSTGFCTVDTGNLEMIANCNFDCWYRGGEKGFAISSNQRVLAIAMSRFIGEDPVSGENKFHCVLEVFSLVNGEKLDELVLGENYHPTVSFLPGDREITVAHEDLTRSFELLSSEV